MKVRVNHTWIVDLQLPTNYFCLPSTVRRQINSLTATSRIYVRRSEFVDLTVNYIICESKQIVKCFGMEAVKIGMCYYKVRSFCLSLLFVVCKDYMNNAVFFFVILLQSMDQNERYWTVLVSVLFFIIWLSL